MARKYFVEDYYVESIADINPTKWLRYVDLKAGYDATDVKLIGVRNFNTDVWHRPHTFAHGKNCKYHTQLAMKNGFVELRVSYTPLRQLLI